MGASGWAYLAPYQANINTALQELRQAVFRQGAYYDPAEFHRKLSGSDILQHLSPDDRQAYLAAIEQTKHQPQPQTIEELIEANGPEGTHSILDIEGIAAEAGFGVAAPLSKETLLHLFGTERPTREMVIQSAEAIQELRRRWEGTYVIVYQNDLPSEIYFTGYSGD